jgi:hypothetical protein
MSDGDDMVIEIPAPLPTPRFMTDDDQRPQSE